MLPVPIHFFLFLPHRASLRRTSNQVELIDSNNPRFALEFPDGNLQLKFSNKSRLDFDGKIESAESVFPQR